MNNDYIDINSNDNTLFVTGQCNNRCLMCCQPPLKCNDIELLFKKNIDIIKSAPSGLQEIGITGGEPTLLNNKLFELLGIISEYLPNTHINILTNGRKFADRSYTQCLTNYKKDKLLFGIPLHSDFYADHDFISQVQGSFNETISGLYHLAQIGMPIELRIIVTKLNYSRLKKISKFIFMNLPFAQYISFMGIEYTGYMIKNQSLLWIDPFDYRNQLEEAVHELDQYGMNVSIFNVPHCLLKKSVFQFAYKSISDWKQCYLECCDSCFKKENCCGLFTTSKRQSAHISPIHYI